ncbi:MAG: TetR/AcrR family transcriptional regulator [Halioglobus sp.]|nr:TetR/AcrR family transcriptional regulator [Halioglobus sp.]
MAARGRPKSDEKRQQILAAAAQLFTGQGYERTSLEQVAVEAGVSKQTIYNNFPSKEALLRTCILHRCEEANIAGEDLDFSLPPEQFLPLFAERFISTLTEAQPVAMYRLVMAESERHPEVGEAFYESGPKPVVTALADYFERATARGELAVDQPMMAATQYLFMIKGFTVDMALVGIAEEARPFPTDSYVQYCTDLFLRANAVA